MGSRTKPAFEHNGYLLLKVSKKDVSYLHGMQLRIRRFTFGKLYGCDAQTPYICFVIITALLDDFWRHPVRCAYERILLGG